MLEALQVGFSGALLAWMLVDFMQPDMIFEKYGKWLERNEEKWWSSPLGGCIYCFTVWVVLGMVAFYIFVPVLWQVLTAISIGHIIISIFDKTDL